MSQQRRVTRRGVLAMGSGLAAAAVAGSVGTGTASASVPSSQRFDLTQPSYDLFRGKSLYQGTVMQSFTFDNVNRRLFVAQLRNGSGSDAAGDLCITQLDFAGNQIGHMFLNGFGHGVSIGVEPVGSTSYLWTEVDSVNARGTRLARFPFTSGTTLDHASPVLDKHLPIAGVDTVTCATDPVNQRLVMRYRTGGAFRFAAYTIADVRAGNYSNRLADIAQPSGLGTFQGYAVYGEYVYMLDGDAYSGTNPPPGNAHVSSLNLNTGAFTRAVTNAGGSLSYREPEGMAVYRTVAGETRLFLGMASGTTAGARLANIFYKNVLI
ncbi:hypothetical protein Atai01_13410 [Amycolatopsis taiwanensis]|uniref:P68 RBP/TagC-like beta-propeller domain-containing protein n=2 Tax=Amycolatopsis taiwanensis TaxID=342230 RepID=A0A9W6QZ95_9PSEU|nr:hypothetical protein Atai01_13410 [Amycolatopsis taiwanensis]